MRTQARLRSNFWLCSPGARVQHRYRRLPGIAQCIAVVLAGALLLPAPALAGEPLRWEDEWRPMQTADWAVVVGGAAATVGSFLLIAPSTSPRWRGPILFDEPVTRAIGAETNAGRERARVLSDIPYFAFLIATPFVDPLIAALGRDSPRVAKEMFGIYGEVFAITGLIGVVLPLITSRERPLAGAVCDDDPTNSNCHAVSFPSGHTAMVFASASAMATQHAFIPLYGGGAAEVIAVSAVAALAAATGVGRIVSQKHHPTDVVSGALIGATVGFVVPYFLHFRWPRRENSAVTVRSAPVLTAEGPGWNLSLQW